VADSSTHGDRREQLARIEELWRQLEVERDPKKREALTKRIRLEADAFQKVLGPDDPKP
jgi:hypothetical protein